uniref:Uncharacterized protein n=1 Tax=Vitis vinifera TaxID=29760 RepID=F6H8I0_VITVI
MLHGSSLVAHYYSWKVWKVCTVTWRLIFGRWDFLGCMVIGDGMDTILRLKGR